MTSLAAALIAELDDRQLQSLAERLRPFLGAPTGTPADDGWLDGVDEIAAYLGCPESRLYDPRYRAESGIPLYKDGRAWTAKKPELDNWRRGRLEHGGTK